MSLPNIPPAGYDHGKQLAIQSETTEEQENEETEGLDAGEVALLAYLSGEPLHVDDLCRLSGLPIASVTSMLTLLEIKGKVEQVGSMHYVKASPELAREREVTHGD